MIGLLGLGAALAAIGQPVEQHDLGSQVRVTRGVEVDEATGSLLVLDARAGGSVQVFRGEALAHQASHPLPAPLSAPRGLAARREGGAPVAWVLDWDEATAQASLWRQDLEGGQASSVALAPLGITTEPTGLAWHDDTLWIAVWPTSTDDGLVKITLPDGGWAAWTEGALPTARTLPGSGHREHDTWQPSRGLGVATIDGEPYLVGTASPDDVVVMDVHTGRALFALPVPSTLPSEPRPAWGVAAGPDGLWVMERSKGAERLHRLDSTTGLDTPDLGPWKLRHLRLSITTEPKPDAPRHPGPVMHTFGHPVPLVNQQAVPDTRQARSLTPERRVQHQTVTWYPADDRSTPVLEDRFVYPDVRPRAWHSEVEVEALVRTARWTILPHRVSGDEAPPGYTDDSPIYGLSEREIYDGFLDRVRTHVTNRYGLTRAQVDAELAHPYWAARDVTETLFALYWYPDADAGHPTTQDPEHGHFRGSPAPPKLALSATLDGDEVVACNGGNVMLDGVMRYLGHSARWLGSTHAGRGDGLSPDDPDAHWDRDGDGFLGPDEAQVGVNGHRWTQVWLGPRYGWQKFDATPEARAHTGDLGPPPGPSQWDLVREAGGGLPADRVVLTVGSGVHEPMYRRFPPPITGGDQDYNLMGLYGAPQHWRYPQHDITWSTPLALADVAMTDDAPEAVVRWRAAGPWDRVPGATVTVIAERWQGDRRNGRPRVLASGVPVEAGFARGDLPAAPQGMRWRAVVTQDGDPLVGGRSR